MARTTGSDGERTEAAIREAALKLIARHGYDAVSMRQLGEEVGVQAAALYRYFPTKEDLLFTLMREHMEGLIASWETARPLARDPLGGLSAFVRNLGNRRYFSGGNAASNGGNTNVVDPGLPRMWGGELRYQF